MDVPMTDQENARYGRCICRYTVKLDASGRAVTHFTNSELRAICAGSGTTLEPIGPSESEPGLTNGR